MVYKYENEISKIATCPPDGFVEDNREAYRFVKSNDMRNSFLPAALISSGRTFKDNEKCLAYGISLFDTFENAKRRKDALKKRHKNIEKKIGEEIAKGEIKPEHGKCSSINTAGHFTLFENEGVVLQEIFSVEQELAHG